VVGDVPIQCNTHIGVPQYLNKEGFDGKKVVEEAKVLSWRILK
jgi:hypothetical protein